MKFYRERMLVYLYVHILTPFLTSNFFSVSHCYLQWCYLLSGEAQCCHGSVMEEIMSTSSIYEYTNLKSIDGPFQVQGLGCGMP